MPCTWMCRLMPCTWMCRLMPIYVDVLGADVDPGACSIEGGQGLARCSRARLGQGWDCLCGTEQGAVWGSCSGQQPGFFGQVCGGAARRAARAGCRCGWPSQARHRGASCPCGILCPPLPPSLPPEQ